MPVVTCASASSNKALLIYSPSQPQQRQLAIALTRWLACGSFPDWAIFTNNIRTPMSISTSNDWQTIEPDFSIDVFIRCLPEQ